MPTFCVKSVKIYTGQKNLHWRRQWRQWQLSGMRCKGERRYIELYESLREFWIYPGITSEPANFGEILTQEVPKEVVSFLAKHEALSETDITKLRISFSTSFKNIIVHILSLAQYQYITQMLTSFTSFKVNVFDGWKQIRGSCFSIRIQKGWRKMD